MLAAQSIAGDDGALEVVLGLGVMLTFTGLLLRALAGRVSRSRLGMAVTARLDAAARPSGAPAPAQPQESASSRIRCPRSSSSPPSASPRRDGCPTSAWRRLARTLDDSRRLLAAEERVAAALAELPNSFWLVERNVFVGSRRIPFLALGATGVFALSPSDGHWTARGPRRRGPTSPRRCGAQLPGYAGPVLGAVCLAFDDLAPRTWHGAGDLQGRGGWLLGLEWLLPWMFSFEPDDGLRRGDVRRLDETSGPSWHRCRTARLPAARNHG